MGCLPHALLVTIEDAADGGLRYNSSPALRSASRAAPPQGAGGDAGGAAAPRPPAAAARASPPAPGCWWTAPQPRVPPPTPSGTCRCSRDFAGGGRWVRRWGERGELGFWAAGHRGRALPPAPPRGK